MNMTTANGVSQVVAGSINYAPFGGVSNWTYGNNLARTLAYDMDGRVTGLWAGTATSAVQGLSYGHNANDEITAISNGIDANLSQTYAYDTLGRLTAQVLPGSQIGLAYDGVGNRTARTDNGATTVYGYAASTHRLSNLSVGGTATRWFNTNAVGNIDAWHGMAWHGMAWHGMARTGSTTISSTTLSSALLHTDAAV